MGNFGGNVVVDAVEFNWEVTRYKWGHPEGGAEVITGIDDSAV